MKEIIPLEVFKKAKEHCQKRSNCVDCPLFSWKSEPNMCNIAHQKADRLFGPRRAAKEGEAPYYTRLYIAQFDDPLKRTMEEARLHKAGMGRFVYKEKQEEQLC